MKSRHDRRICLGFQWVSWDNIPVLGEALFERLGERKVLWNLPAVHPDTPPRKKASLVKMIRARLNEGRDCIASMGFMGACHPLLNLDELSREAAWGLKNPWGTGISDLLDLPVPFMMPRVPDIIRPGARKVYRENGFTRVGVCCAPLPRLVHDASGFFPFQRIAAATLRAGGPESRLVRRLLASADDLFLVLDLSGIEQPEQLKPALDEIVEPFPPTETSLLSSSVTTGTAPDDAPAPTGWRMDWTPFPPPVLHARIAAASAIARKKRKKNEEYSELLTLLGPGDGAPPQGCTEEKGKSLLVAHMQGEVALAGSDFDVRLTGGRFCGVTRRGKDILPHTPARSYMRLTGAASRPGGGARARSGGVAARVMPFKTRSSFSFEGDDSTGLREELEIQGQDGAGISIEYSFRGESPLLSIDVHVRLPAFPADSRVDEYAPLLLVLRELRKGEKVEIGVTAPDGSEASVNVGEESGDAFLPGAAHRIRRADGGWIRLTHDTASGMRWGLPFFRVKRLRGARMLECNPFGSFTPMPGAALSGMRGTFSLQLGLEE